MNNDTRNATTSIAPAEYLHASTDEDEAFGEPGASVGSWLFVETLETDTRTLLGLGTEDSSSAKSWFAAMSLSSVIDTESARGFVASIPVKCALLDEVPTQSSKSLTELGRVIGGSKAAPASATAVVSLAATLTVSLMAFWPRVFLALLVRAIVQDVRPRIEKRKVQDGSSKFAKGSCGRARKF